MTVSHSAVPRPRASARPIARHTGITGAALLLSLHGGAFGQGTAGGSEVTTLPEISVSAGREEEVYQRRSTRSATRTDTPVKEVPQAISVIPQEVLEDLGETTIDTALELGGVGRGNYFAGGFNSYNVRGFDSSGYYRNGIYQGTGFGGVPDSAGLESVDVVRGPASLTFGSSDPGGTFNLVTKRPQPDAAYDLGLMLNSHGGRRATADLTGPVNDSGTLQYRLNMAIDDGDTFRDHVRINREYFAPRLSWQIAPRTRVMLDVDYLRARTPLDRGIPMLPGQLHGLPDVSTYTGEPGARRITNEHTAAQLRLEHALSDNWSLDVGLQRTVGGLEGESVEIGALQTDRRTVARNFGVRENHWHGNQAQAFVRGKVTLAGMEHQILAGAEYRQDYSSVWQRRPPNAADYPLPLDIYAPVYGAALPPATPSTMPSRAM